MTDDGDRNGKRFWVANCHASSTPVDDTRTTGAAIGNTISTKAEAAPATLDPVTERLMAIMQEKMQRPQA